MRQVLFHVPFINLPVYGYGLMLFFAFLGCSWLAKRLCRREGIDGKMIPDMAIVLFITGILGGRLVYVIQYWDTFVVRDDWWSLIKLWDGGLVLYGALAGGTLGYFGFWWHALRPHGVSNWKMVDITAPCVALGIAFGRIGCLCTGCCYGNVACEGCPAIHFPIYTNTSPQQFTGPTGDMIRRGYQTSFGFLLNEHTLEVKAVEPGTPAESAGLTAHDLLLTIKRKVRKPKENDQDNETKFEEKVVPIHRESELYDAVVPLEITVRRDGNELALPPFMPTSIGVHPTQIYETISMCLLLFFLLSYYPYKRHDGELFVLFLIGYGMHRFLNEMLRTDTTPVAFGMTLSQNVSLLVLVFAAALATIVWRRPLIGQAEPAAVPATELVPTK